MPPLPTSDACAQSNPESDVVTVNVGGQLFQTTKQTLSQAGSQSPLSSVSSSSFIDRDPDLFSIFLSLLRTGHLPSKANSFDLQDLILESRFYGIESLLINSLSNPVNFDAFNLVKSHIIPLNGRDSASTIATAADGSAAVAHGSKITWLDWSLRRKNTILTQFTEVDSLLVISPGVVAAGATDFPGLQLLDLEKGSLRHTLNWENSTRSSSTVQAIGRSDELLFTSFESSRRNSNSIMVYDLHSLRPVTEVAHNEIYGAEIDSAIPAAKLNWVSSYSLLMAAGSHSGPSGVLGSIKFWDVRSGNAAFELNEKVDCFADVTVSDGLSAVFKVGLNSGEVYYADMRKLQDENPWFCLGDRSKVISNKKEGIGCKIESHANQVFCTKGGRIELWTEVAMGSSWKIEGAIEERVFKRNLMGKMKDMEGPRVTKLAFGGSKMFVTRKDQQLVEVWQRVQQGDFNLCNG